MALRGFPARECSKVSALVGLAAYLPTRMQSAMEGGNESAFLSDAAQHRALRSIRGVGHDERFGVRRGRG
jgi:hypothetical protein